MSLVSTNIIATVMRLSADQFTAGAKQANKALDTLTRSGFSLQGGLQQLRGSLLGMAGPAAAAGAAVIGVSVAMAGTVRSAIALGGELFDLSQRTGETVESLSLLKFAAEQEGVALGQVTVALRFLSVNALKAKDSTSEAGKAFAKLGVDVKDANGEIKTGSALLEEVGAALAKLPPGAQRTAAAVQLFGRAGQSIVPVAVNLAEARKRFEELGGAISTDFATKADQFSDRMGEIRFLLTRAGIAIAETLLPSLINLANAFINTLGPAIAFATRHVRDFQFWASKAGAANQLLTGGTTVLSGLFLRLGKDVATGGTAFKELVGQLTQSRAEWERLNPVVDAFANANRNAGTSTVDITERLKDLAVEFKDLGKDAIAPVVAVAKDLAGEDGLGVLSKQFRGLVTELKGLAQTSDVAARALAEVFKIQKEGIRQIPIEQMKTLADRFKDLDKEAIAPVLSVARELASDDDGLGALGKQFQALVTELTRVAQTSPAAAKALEEVLKVQQAAIAQQLQLEQQLQGPATREGQGPQRIGPEEQQAAIAQGLRESAFGGTGEVQGPVTAGGIGPEAIVPAAAGAEALAAGLLKAADAASMVNGEFATMEQAGMGVFAALEGTATVFVDSLLAIGASFEDAGQAAIDFFRELLLSFARAIVRGLILAAIMSAIGLGPGINIKKIVTGAASAAGGIGFQDQESSMLGRSAQARSVATGIGGGQLPGAASGLPTPNVTVTPTVQINQATPMTWARVVDENVMPRLRTRQRRLNDDLT